jgi:alpha-methylacyl-CoA racemase
MGPLAGLRIVEFAGIGPGPMAAMLFADLGARVIRVDRISASDLGIAVPTRFELLTRSRPSVAVDLKHPDGIALAGDLAAKADGLIEGFRPGTMERLGLGPNVLLARNPRLVYGRMTGWGQTGPLAHAAGHDLNYLALVGGLHAIGRAGAKPTPPLNLVADFGGGALYLAFGMACALLEAQRSGKGQVVDAAMTEGAASLMTLFYGLHAAGRHSLERGTNLLDSGSAIYDVYECADGLFISVAAIEAKFRKVLFDRLGLPLTADEGEELRGTLEKLFKTRSRDEWCALLEGTDACFAPVLSMPVAPLSKSMAWCSLPPRPASLERLPPGRHRRKKWAPTRGLCCADGTFRRNGSRRCWQAVYWPRRKATKCRQVDPARHREVLRSLRRRSVYFASSRIM